MFVLRCQWFCNYYNIHTCIIHNIAIDFKDSITFKQSQVWPYRFQKHLRTCTYSKQGLWFAGKTKGMVIGITPVSLKTIGSAGYRDQWNKRFGWGEGQSILFRHPPGSKETDTWPCFRKGGLKLYWTKEPTNLGSFI